MKTFWIIFAISVGGIFYAYIPLLSSPIEEKEINTEYYFTQQATGMAFSIERAELVFYKKIKYWFDKEIGHISWKWGAVEVEAKIIYTNSSLVKSLILTANNHVVMDTVLNLATGFDFEYSYEP